MKVYWLRKESGRIYSSEDIVSEVLGMSLKHRENGAPYIDGGPFISITDTASFWACALSDVPVGIDMEEKKREFKPSVVNRLHPLEKKYLDGLSEGSSEWNSEALNIWTRKEAFMKLSEEGLAKGLKSFSAVDRLLEYCSIDDAVFTEINLNNVLICCCVSSDTGTEVIKAEYGGRFKETALEKAAAFISDRAYSSDELKKKLIGKGYSSEDAQDAVNLLMQRGYLSDEDYAESLIKKLEIQGKGALKIRQELRKRGIDISYEADDELTRALTQAEKLWESSAKDEKAKAKIMRRLASLGYESHVIYRVIEKL